MRQEDIEDNLRMKERAKEFVRMKKLEEMEEKRKRAERKMNRSLEKDKENLLIKFNAIMSQRGFKSKDEVMKQLFDGDDGYDYRSNNNTKSMVNFLSGSSNKTFKKESEKIKEDDDEYNDFQKEDNFFVTNLPKDPVNQQIET